MALKAILATLDGLDEALKPLYKKTDDGKYALEVEGLTDNRSKLDEGGHVGGQRAEDLAATRGPGPGLARTRDTGRSI